MYIGVSVSGYQVAPQPLTNAEIVQIGKTCGSKSAQSCFGMDDIKDADRSGVEIIAPSQCDSKI
jgi:hypothetical protein